MEACSGLYNLLIVDRIRYMLRKMVHSRENDEKAAYSAHFRTEASVIPSELYSVRKYGTVYLIWSADLQRMFGWMDGWAGVVKEGMNRLENDDGWVGKLVHA